MPGNHLWEVPNQIKYFFSHISPSYAQ